MPGQHTSGDLASAAALGLATGVAVCAVLRIPHILETSSLQLPYGALWQLPVTAWMLDGTEDAATTDGEDDDDEWDGTGEMPTLPVMWGEPPLRT